MGINIRNRNRIVKRWFRFRRHENGGGDAFHPNQKKWKKMNWSENEMNSLKPLFSWLWNRSLLVSVFCIRIEWLLEKKERHRNNFGGSVCDGNPMGNVEVFFFICFFCLCEVDGRCCFLPFCYWTSEKHSTKCWLEKKSLFTEKIVSCWFFFRGFSFLGFL